MMMEEGAQVREAQGQGQGKEEKERQQSLEGWKVNLGLRREREQENCRPWGKDRSQEMKDSMKRGQR